MYLPNFKDPFKIEKKKIKDKNKNKNGHPLFGQESLKGFFLRQNIFFGYNASIYIFVSI